MIFQYLQFLSLTLEVSPPFFQWIVGRKMLFLQSFLLCCYLLSSSRSILIISFCKKSMNLLCSEFFFFSQGLSGLCFSSSAAICNCSNSHCFSERIWLLFLFQNLNWLNSSMQCWMIGSCSLIRFSNLLLILTLSTLFQMNLTIRLAYLTDRLSYIWMVCKLMVSSNTTYLISPLALQQRLPSQSQWKKKNSNLTPSFFMNQMQSIQLTLYLLLILTRELQALMLRPYFIKMKPSRMKISPSYFQRMRVIALMVIKVSARVLLTMRFLMFLAAAVACTSRNSFTAQKKICELTFSQNLLPFLKVSTVRISLPMTSPDVRCRLVQMQSPFKLVRSERSTSA